MFNTLLKSELAETHGWMTPDALEAQHAYKAGQIWLGRNPFNRETPFGVDSDRHTIVIGAAGQGIDSSIVIPNACLWPESLVALDFGGDLTKIAAQRRNAGSVYSDGLDQNVHIIDPFCISGASPEELASYNPLDQIRLTEHDLHQDINVLCDILVSKSVNQDAIWTDYARQLLAVVIQYVMRAPRYDDERNLLTVNSIVKKLNDSSNLRHFLNDAKEVFAGDIQGLRLLNKFSIHSQKVYQSALIVLSHELSFLDSPQIAKCLETSSFSALEELQNSNTVFICVPNSMASLHTNWLRLILSQLAIVSCFNGEQHPKSSRVLFLLNDFHTVGSVPIIMNMLAAGQASKLSFFLACQSLVQLKRIYSDCWENIVVNCGTRVFLGSNDHFTNDYIARSFNEPGTSINTRSKSYSRTHLSSSRLSNSEDSSDFEDNFGPSSFFSSGELLKTSSNTTTSTTSGRAENQGYAETSGWQSTTGISTSTRSLYDDLTVLATEHNTKPELRLAQAQAAAILIDDLRATDMPTARSLYDDLTVLATEHNTEPELRLVQAQAAATLIDDLRATDMPTARSLFDDLTVLATEHNTEPELRLVQAQAATSLINDLRATDMQSKRGRRLVGSAMNIDIVLGAVSDIHHPAFPGLLLVSINAEPPATLRRTPYYLDPYLMRRFDPLPEHALFSDRREIRLTREAIVPEKKLEEAAHRIIARGAQDSERSTSSKYERPSLVDEIINDESIAMDDLLAEFRKRAHSIEREANAILTSVRKRIAYSRELRRLEVDN